MTPGWGAPFNCEDMQGTQVNFKTIDAKPRIHVESIASGGKTLTCSRKNAEDLDDLCKAMPGNTAYCGFSTPKAQRMKLRTHSVSPLQSTPRGSPRPCVMP